MTGLCEVCGNKYDKMLEINLNGEVHHFDCFECAIHGLAPRCNQCGVRILGHGLEESGQYYCCAHCARIMGQNKFIDRVEFPASEIQI